MSNHTHTEQLLPEHEIVVVFDVEAHTREAAAALVRDALNLRPGGELRTALDRLAVTRSARMEAWWFPEPDLKHVDGNDRDSLVLQHSLVCAVCDAPVAPHRAMKAFTRDGLDFNVAEGLVTCTDCHNVISAEHAAAAQQNR